MNCLFLFKHKLTNQQIEQQYLLMIAMLNFDFKVHILFEENVFNDWLKHKPLKQKLMALDMYGVDEFLILTGYSNSEKEELAARVIDDNELKQLMSTADFIS